jgi:arsenate reductase (glutaredoxin)
MTLTVYGIPTCDSCKKALAWLESKGVVHTFINTKEQSPTQAQLTDWVATLGNKPLRNTSGKSYRALGEEKQSWSDSRWVTAFAQDAMLIKRPLFVKEGTALMTGFRAADLEKMMNQ